MYLCTVTGTIVAPEKSEALPTVKLLTVHPMKPSGELAGRNEMIALDPRFGAGVGDVVLVAKQGQVVHQIMGSDSIPANVIVLGVVDDWAAPPS